MSRGRLAWRAEGWRPAGRGRCICPRCFALVSTNALGRSSHRCPPSYFHLLADPWPWRELDRARRQKAAQL